MRHLGLKIRMAIVSTILFAFFALAAGVAMVLFNLSLPIVLALAVGFAGFQYLLGTKMALWSVGADDMPEDQYREIHRAVERMSDDLGIDKPRLMVAQMGVPNAFATGRKGNGTVVVSTELIHTLQQDELEGVLAHELAHIANRDVVTMTLGQSVAAIVGIVVQWLVIATGDNEIADLILGWIAGMLTQMFVMIFVLAISRYREYVADSDAADVIGSGEPLARALEKIQRGAQGRESNIDDSVSALCIFGDGGGVKKLFSTHPDTEERIRRLRSY
ncbi:Heat shock protein. Metallo peptidase. MEROPS family M48B [Natronoarchaeum philippinense]|uniref:Protease HtpX homolog n=1 Tax=Natronoarchaeum philippinense TaxID=558529 RepID=A0A285NTT3_NATPI|nr:M48 family metalloprotease [Natronoarchaeum philippinense]SNZ12870.1 Heat shock protein. Metallo peptidase. MEROPS family M48B [Natronoarchaeum philippinense]